MYLHAGVVTKAGKRVEKGEKEKRRKGKRVKGKVRRVESELPKCAKIR